MKTTLLIGSVATLLSIPASASQGGSFAQRACMIEGSFALLGQTIRSKDCMQASPAEKDEAVFRQSCSELANVSAAMGGKPGKVTYLARCETPAQGTCKNLMGSGRDAYYYARSADDLAALPASCELLRGKWLPGR